MHGHVCFIQIQLNCILFINFLCHFLNVMHSENVNPSSHSANGNCEFYSHFFFSVKWLRLLFNDVIVTKKSLNGQLDTASDEGLCKCTLCCSWVCRLGKVMGKEDGRGYYNSSRFLYFSVSAWWVTYHVGSNLRLGSWWTKFRSEPSSIFRWSRANTFSLIQTKLSKVI